MKTKLVLCMLSLAFVLTACGNDTKTIGNQNATIENTTAADAEAITDDVKEAKVLTGYYLTVNGYDVCIDEAMEAVCAGVGAEESYFEAPSCAFDGIEKTYTYSNGGVVVKTYLGTDKVDYVNNIIIKNDLVSTNEGLTIGDNVDKVVECYGEDFKDNNGSYEYTKDNMKLLVVMEEGTVVSIQYISNFLEQ